MHHSWTRSWTPQLTQNHSLRLTRISVGSPFVHSTSNDQEPVLKEDCLPVQLPARLQNRGKLQLALHLERMGDLSPTQIQVNGEAGFILSLGRNEAASDQKMGHNLSLGRPHRGPGAFAFS